MQRYKQINRIIKLIEWLSLGERLTTGIVEERFDYNVNRRDIQRDFNTIFDSGIPIEYEMHNKERVWFFQDAYRKRFSSLFNRKNDNS